MLAQSLSKGWPACCDDAYHGPGSDGVYDRGDFGEADGDYAEAQNIEGRGAGGGGGGGGVGVCVGVGVGMGVGERFVGSQFRLIVSHLFLFVSASVGPAVDRIFGSCTSIGSCHYH